MDHFTFQPEVRIFNSRIFRNQDSGARMKIYNFLLLSLLMVTPVLASELQDATPIQNVATDLPETDEMGDAFRAFDDDLRSYECVADQVPVEENPVWKVWLARIAGAVYSTCIATKKLTLRYYHACRARVIRVYRSFAQRAAAMRNETSCHAQKI